MENKATNERELTFGEQAVSLNFNPANNPEVQKIKVECAAAIDTLHGLRMATEDGEKKRMYSVAITQLQDAQMWGVKAATWGL